MFAGQLFQEPINTYYTICTPSCQKCRFPLKSGYKVLPGEHGTTKQGCDSSVATYVDQIFIRFLCPNSLHDEGLHGCAHFTIRNKIQRNACKDVGPDLVSRFQSVSHCGNVASFYLLY